jgi:hypothetical protein
MIKKFSSKLKNQFIDMLNNMVKMFSQILNEYVSNVSSFVEIIKGISKSKILNVIYISKYYKNHKM